VYSKIYENKVKYHENWGYIRRMQCGLNGFKQRWEVDEIENIV
jgi:hypothetical protein